MSISPDSLAARPTLDHETIALFVWHKVAMNTEGQARAMRHVVFLD